VRCSFLLTLAAICAAALKDTPRLGWCRVVGVVGQVMPTRLLERGSSAKQQMLGMGP
jgi:hypothetical protein